MIKTISLINCQSWDNSTIELASDRVNVLQADNNVGKSVLFKMLKITADPKAYSATQRRELIRWGTNGAIILFTFTDGAQGYTQVLYNGVSYYYNGSMYAAPPAEYLEHIGLLTSNGMIANLMDARQDLLLVNPDLKANYDLMQLLVHNDSLENVRENTEENLKTYNIKSDMLNIAAGVLERQLSQFEYTDLEKKKRSYEVGKTCYDVIYDVIVPALKEVECMQSEEAPLDFDELTRVYRVLEVLHGLDFEHVQVEDFDTNLMQVWNVVDALMKCEWRSVGQLSFDYASKEIYHVLDVLRALDFDKLEVGAEVGSAPYEVLKTVAEIDFTPVTVDKGLRAEIERLHEELKGDGAVYDCPVFGQVIYDGDACRPIGELS